MAVKYRPSKERRDWLDEQPENFATVINKLIDQAMKAQSDNDSKGDKDGKTES